MIAFMEESQQYTYKVFISHAAKDEELVSELMILLTTGCNIKTSDIFCTSKASKQIDAGSDFSATMVEALKNSQHAVFLMSENFIESPNCNIEIGISLAQENQKRSFLAIAPVKFSRAPSFIKNREFVGILNVGESKTLDNLHDILSETKQTATWNKNRDKFMEKLKSIIPNLQKPEKVDRAKFDKLKEKFSELEIKYKEATDKIKEFSSFCEGRHCEKKAEGIAILKVGMQSQEEKYQNLVKAASSALNNLREFTKWSIFSIDYAETGPLNNGDFDMYASDYKEAKQRNEMSEDSYNDNNTRVMDAIDTLRELDHFINSDSNIDFISSKGKKLGTEVSLRNKDYWDIEL